MKVKIELDPAQSPDSGEESLFKALEAQRDGSTHAEDFPDPAMRDVVARINHAHSNMWDAMIGDIMEVLDQEDPHGSE